MLRVWRRAAPCYETVEAADFVLTSDIVWIELISPSRDEELAVERATKLEMPTREEMAEIELSSRLYKINTATYMTAQVVVKSHSQTGTATLAPVTFILGTDQLVTIRYENPKSFELFAAQAEREPDLCASGARIFLGLMGAMIDRLADILEQTGLRVEETAAAVFQHPRGEGFQPIMRRLGQQQNLNVKIHESLSSLSRVLAFAALDNQFVADPDSAEELRSQQGDVQSLVEHVGYLASNIAFLLDAALGLIGIEQNEIAKLFSITAVVLMPPTLVGAIYGMNFDHIPELHWKYGYPFSIILMILSAALPFWWVKKKKWL